MDDNLMAEFANIDPTYADGIAGFMDLGTTFAVLYFRWAPNQSEHGLITMGKVPVVSIIRPKASIMPCNRFDCGFLKWVETVTVPRPQSEVPLH